MKYFLVDSHEDIKFTAMKRLQNLKLSTDNITLTNDAASCIHIKEFRGTFTKKLLNYCHSVNYISELIYIGEVLNIS